MATGNLAGSAEKFQHGEQEMFVPNGNKPLFPKKDDEPVEPKPTTDQDQPMQSPRLNPFPGWRHAIEDEFIATL